MKAFVKLSWAAKICHAQFPFLALVDEWGQKRQHVAVLQVDMPELVRSYGTQATKHHRGNARMLEVDPFPGLRLASACESLANSIYGLCEIAGAFANKASQGRMPQSFNAIQKMICKGELDEKLVGSVANLEWYSRIREIRTEWAHHSTVFIGQDAHGPLVVVHPFRRKSDKVFLPEKAILRVHDLVEWSGNAVQVVDFFGLEMFHRFVLPKLNLDQEVIEPARDASGFYILKADGNLEVNRVTIREYLRHGGIEV